MVMGKIYLKYVINKDGDRTCKDKENTCYFYGTDCYENEKVKCKAYENKILIQVKKPS